MHRHTVTWIDMVNPICPPSFVTRGWGGVGGIIQQGVDWNTDLDVHVPVSIHEVHQFLHVAQLLVPLSCAVVAKVITMGHQNDVTSVQLSFLLVLFPQSPGPVQICQQVPSA